MQVYAVPIESKFLIYRPLLPLAFVGNQPMADLALRLAHEISCIDMPEEVLTFLQASGFLEPDPPPPPSPDRAYHPTMAVLLLTNRCNLRCTYCYASGGEGVIETLSPELARTAIDYVRRNAVDQNRPHFELTFHGGGEPLQSWNILTLATAYARSRELPCRVSVVSNGVWSARQRAWILDHLDHLSISFDGRQETQDRQRPRASGRGSFKAVMRTIEALDQAGFQYGIRMTATAPWRGQLPEDVRFICQETGCQVMQVEPAFNIIRGRHQDATQAESEAFVDAFMEAFEIAQRAGRRLTYSGARPWLQTSSFCSAPYGALIVTPKGDLVSCYEIASDSHALAQMSTVGHIIEGQVVIDDRARNALLTYLEEKRARCRDCFCYWTCAGDCYTRSFSSSSRCYMNREITARILLWYIMASDGVWRGQATHPQEKQLMKTF